MTTDSVIHDPPLPSALVGTWELLTREDHTLDGVRLVEPSLGSDPIALLVYDRAGHFAAQFMKRHRESAPDDASIGGAHDNSRARGGYDAYFGTSTVDDVNSTVTQRLIGALSPENVGQVLTRAATVSGDQLTIQLETATALGEPTVRRTVLKRRRTYTLSPSPDSVSAGAETQI